MTFLQIGNREDVRPLLEQVPVHLFALPPLMMFFVTAKGFFLLIFNLAIIILISSAGWKASSFTNYDSDSDKYQKKTNGANTNFGFDDVDRNESTTPSFNEHFFNERAHASSAPDVNIWNFKFQIALKHN